MSLKKIFAIAFMCHQKPERSFFLHGKQFPLCARCTGLLIGYIIGILLAVLTHCNGYTYFMLLMIPMILDGSVQYFYKIESNNIRRLITGISGGVGIVYVFISIHMFTVWYLKILLHKMSIL